VISSDARARTQRRHRPTSSLRRRSARTKQCDLSSTPSAVATKAAWSTVRRRSPWRAASSSGMLDVVQVYRDVIFSQRDRSAARAMSNDMKAVDADVSRQLLNAAQPGGAISPACELMTCVCVHVAQWPTRQPSSCRAPRRRRSSRARAMLPPPLRQPTRSRMPSTRCSPRHRMTTRARRAPVAASRRPRRLRCWRRRDRSRSW
jgi:hypothetical protein